MEKKEAATTDDQILTSHGAASKEQNKKNKLECRRSKPAAARGTMKSCKRVVYTYFILSFKGTESFAGKGDEGYYKFLPSLLVVCAKNAPHEHHGKQHNSNRDEVRRRRTMLASSEGRVIEFISTSLCFWEKRGGDGRNWKRKKDQSRATRRQQRIATCTLFFPLPFPTTTTCALRRRRTARRTHERASVTATGGRRVRMRGGGGNNGRSSFLSRCVCVVAASAAGRTTQPSYAPPTTTTTAKNIRAGSRPSLPPPPPRMATVTTGWEGNFCGHRTVAYLTLVPSKLGF